MPAIAELIAHPERLNKDTLFELRELVAKYPYFQAARLLLLQNLFLLHDTSFGEELRRAALYIPDRRRLFQMVEGGHYEIKPTPIQREVAEEKSASDRTASLIDDFLSTSEEPSAPKRKLTVADATQDYASYLLQLDDAEPTPEEVGGAEDPKRTDRSAALIDDFIENTPDRIRLQDQPEFVPDVEEETENTGGEGADEAFLTMTLAKIYIKQQRYEKALEIIRKVNLNNPKKSSYFADQIRFLQKLIVNKNHNKQ